MNEFRTVISIHPVSLPFSQKQQFLTLGSCFSEAIGLRLKQNKFETAVNPFGVIYNPLSIHKAVSYALFNQGPDDHTYLRQHDVHLNYDFHSTFSSLDPEALKHAITSRVNNVHQLLKTCHCMIITYGSSWAYYRNENNELVANCHKMPGKNFQKRLLDTAEIVSSFEAMVEAIKEINPGMRIVLTVSPVRHIKDTLSLNAVSKSILRTACHALAEKFAHVEYFPAYEIMLDDLRDYRFYKRDMIHPTEQAEDYIWEKFTEQFIDAAGQQFITKWKNIQAALSHKPFHEKSAGHNIFLKDTLRKLEELQSIVNVDEEINAIREQIEKNST